MHQGESTLHYFLRFSEASMKEIDQKMKDLQNSKLDSFKKSEEKSTLLNDLKFFQQVNSFFKNFELEQKLKEQEEEKTFQKKLASVFDLIYLSQIFLQINFSEEYASFKTNKEFLEKLDSVYQSYYQIFSKDKNSLYLSKDQLNEKFSQLESFVKSDSKAIFQFKPEEILILANFNDLNQKIKNEKADEGKEIKNLIVNEGKSWEEKSTGQKKEIFQKIEEKVSENKVVEIKEGGKIEAEEKRYQGSSSHKGHKKPNQYAKNRGYGYRKKEDYDVVEYVEKKY